MLELSVSPNGRRLAYVLAWGNLISVHCCKRVVFERLRDRVKFMTIDERQHFSSSVTFMAQLLAAQWKRMIESWPFLLQSQ